MTGFFEIGFKLMELIITDDSTDNSTLRYNETLLWESGPFPILVALLLSCFVVVALFFDSLLLVDAITSGDSLLFVAPITVSFSPLVVWVDREAHAGNGLPFFWSFTSNS